MVEKPSYEDLEQQVNDLTRQNEALSRNYRSVVEYSMDAILLTAPDGGVLFANPAACELFQMTEQEIIAGGRDVVVDLEDPNLPAAVKERARKGKFIGELRLKKKDGTTFPGEVSSSLFTDADGRTLTSMMIRDLTERKRVEESLRMYQNIVSSTPDGIAFLDRDYRYVVVNNAYEQFSKVPPSQFIGRSVAQYLGEDVFQQKIKPGIDKCLQGEVVNYQDWFDYPALGRRYVDVTYFPYRDDSDRIAGVIANTRDITERRQAQDALMESRERRRQIIENSNAGYFFIDRDGFFQNVNSAWLNMHKYDSAEEVIGKHYALTQTEQDMKDAQRIVEQLLVGGDIVSGEYSRQCKDNSVGYHAFTARPVIEHGDVVGLEGFLIDITERRKAQKALQASEERYRLMFENMMDGFALHRIVTDRQGEPVDYIFLEVNSAFERLTGLKREEIIGKRVTEILPGIEKDPSDWIGRYGKVALTGRQCRFEQNAQNLDKWFSVLAYRPKEGHFATIFEDVTERKRAREALARSEERYRTMMESMTDPLYICSPDFRVEYMNPAMITRTGRNAVGERCYQALHDRDERCEWCIFDQVTDGESVETTVVSPKDKRTYRVTNMPVRNQDGSISKMTIFRDITDYLTALKEKEKVKAQLQQAQKMESIGNLAGGIAHDFNNILSSILGFTELALDDVQAGSAVEDSLQEVYAAGKRAKELVWQILAFARQSDKEVKPIRIDGIIKEVLKFIRSSIPTTIEIIAYIRSESLILGHPTQVHQIMMNLCTNAAHAMEEGGGILEVSLADIAISGNEVNPKVQLPQGNYIEIKVSDTGVGMPAEIMASIFEPYFTTKGTAQGTGLGLAVVHGIVESYGGEIVVESDPGQGSVFTIYLPVTKKRKPHLSYAPEELPMGTERILFVDDEAPIISMGKRMIERLGYRITCRTSSIEALELFRSRPLDFDLVITDMTMPNMTGDRLAVELLKIRRDIPVILCTGYSTQITEESAREIGIKAFVHKPVVKADLARTIRMVMDDAGATSNHPSHLAR